MAETNKPWPKLCRSTRTHCAPCTSPEHSQKQDLHPENSTVCVCVCVFLCVCLYCINENLQMGKKPKNRHAVRFPITHIVNFHTYLISMIFRTVICEFINLSFFSFSLRAWLCVSVVHVYVRLEVNMFTYSQSKNSDYFYTESYICIRVGLIQYYCQGWLWRLSNSSFYKLIKPMCSG